MHRRALVLGLLLAAAVAGCGAPPDPPFLAPAPTSTQLAAPEAVDGQETCRVSEGGAEYYLSVTSKTTGDLSACAGSKRMPADFDVFVVPNIDRRCIISPPSGSYDAIVGVYSDTKKRDLSAARDRCTAEHGADG